MADDPSFRTLLLQARAGDPAAATELVRRNEPTIRRAVRLRLGDGHLRRVLDSLDICQSILAQFFFRMKSGEYDLEQPELLLALLVTMARNKVISQARKFQAGRRDQRRDQAGQPPEDTFVSADPSPSRQVELQELVEKAQGLLRPEEQALWDLRSAGLGWDEIAQRLGSNAAAVRKQWSLALDRIGQELGIDEDNHG
jgi:RNA polymerase sigma-70 factor (ECF subfamily)